MKLFRYRGKRIRPADRDLVFRSACCVVLPVFLAAFALLNLKTILQTAWRRLFMLGVGGFGWHMPYLLLSSIVSAAVAGTVLVLLCRKNWLNWAAAGSATAGVTLAMLALYRVTAYASEHSFYSRLMEMPAATLYRLQLLPVLVPYVCVAALGLLQFFSAEAVRRRQEKKRQDSAKAPSVL